MFSKLRSACRHLSKFAGAALLATPFASPAGTPQLVRDLNLQGDAEPGEFVEFDGQLAFVASDGSNGTRLWITDGTADGTRMVADIYPEPAVYESSRLAVLNGALYLRAYDGIAGRLMRLTSATAQPETLADMQGQVPHVSRPCPWDSPVAVNGDAYLIGVPDNYYLALYKTNGTAAGTEIVTGTLSPFSQPCHLAAYNNRVYFSATSGAASDVDAELWSSNGSLDTVRVADIQPGTRSSNPRWLIEFNNLLYFSATTNNTDNLWRSDGTEAGTFEAARMNEDAGRLRIRGILNGRLLLDSVSWSPSLTHRLLASGGSTADTSLLLSFSTRGADVLVGRTHAYFVASDARGYEPWVTDGTPEGTHLLKDLNPNGDSNPQWFADFNGVTLIATTNEAQGSQLWRSDGTAEGTVLIGNIPEPWTYQGAQENRPFSLRQQLAVGQKFFFVADDPDTGTEVYVLSNDAPVTQADTANTSSGAAVTINVLANDEDADGKIVAESISIATQPSHGTVTAKADGTLVYTPAAGYSGTDTFGYRVTDNQGAISNTTTVTVNTSAPAGGGGDSGSGSRGGGGSMRAIELLALVALLMLGVNSGGARRPRQRTSAAR